MAPNDVWQLTAKGVVHGQQHIHTLHFLQLGDSIGGDDLLTSWTGAPMTAYRGCFDSFSFPTQNVEAKIAASVGPAPSPSNVTPVTASQAGARIMGGSERQPSFLASLVTEKGMLAGRRFSGRFFLGGLYEQDTVNNDLTSGYVALVNAYIAALKTAYVTPSAPPWRLFCYSKLLGDGDPNHTRRNPVPGGPRIADPVAAVAPQLAGSAVRDLVLSPFVTTMRSRKAGHGS